MLWNSWKFNVGLQTADNELLARIIVKEVFRMNGLEVSFQAKPIPGVAGSGEHTHVGIAAKLKNGKMVNLFAPGDMKADFLSAIGYGSIVDHAVHFTQLFAVWRIHDIRLCLHDFIEPLEARF